MKALFSMTCCFLIVAYAHGQGIDPDLLRIKEKLESVQEAYAKATLELHVSFINMPVKHADLHFKKGKPISYTTEDFIFIPKRGLDFSWNELFKYDFFTVDRGTELVNGKMLKVLNAIPADNKADFAIMTLKIDTVLNQIIVSEITTRNEGSYTIKMSYASDSLLPSEVIIEFEVEKIKIPLNFMGKDTKIDKEKFKDEKVKKGIIYLHLEWNNVEIDE